MRARLATAQKPTNEPVQRLKKRVDPRAPDRRSRKCIFLVVQPVFRLLLSADKHQTIFAVHDLPPVVSYRLNAVHESGLQSRIRTRPSIIYNGERTFQESNGLSPCRRSNTRGEIGR